MAAAESGYWEARPYLVIWPSRLADILVTLAVHFRNDATRRIDAKRDGVANGNRLWVKKQIPVQRLVGQVFLLQGMTE